MAVNWGLGVRQQSPIDAFRAAFEQGQERKRETEARNALSAYAQNPNEQGLNALAQFAPEFAIQERGRLAQQQQAQREGQRAGIMDVSRLLNHARDENTYRQSLSVAQRMGLDVSTAPQSFAEAEQSGWLGEQRMIAQVYNDKGPEAFSTAGKIAMDAGLQPGTPQFNKFVKNYVTADLAKPYTGERGETRLYRPQLVDEPISAPPPEAIAKLRADPALAPQFDEIFGPGASSQILGDAGSNASGGFRPVDNGVEALQRVFPNARVTSGYRGPNHPLSQKNPRSWHARSRAAVDIAPIPGMTFEQAKAQLEAQGYGIIEAIDEVNNPSSHATGPHWHFVLGKGR